MAGWNGSKKSYLQQELAAAERQVSELKLQESHLELQVEEFQAQEASEEQELIKVNEAVLRGEELLAETEALVNCWTAWTAKPKESKWRKRADAVPCMLGKVYGSRDQVVIPYALTWRAIDLSPKACANSKPFENVQVELKHRISSSSVETTAAEQSDSGFATIARRSR